MMTTKINSKAIGERFTKERKLWKAKFATASVLAATLLSTSSCSSPQERYESWETKTELIATQKRAKELIAAYNKYFDLYEKGKKNLVELNASGDIAGYQAEFERLETLYEEIKEVEGKIDDLRDKSYELEKDYQEGKATSNSKGTPALPILKRRTFSEHK